MPADKADEEDWDRDIGDILSGLVPRGSVQVEFLDEIVGTW